MIDDGVKGIEVKDARGNILAIDDAGKRTAEQMLAHTSAKKTNKVLFIGNGGSAAIASHMAVDFWKTAGIRSMSFNDAALLTCISNDCGYEQVFARPIEMFAKKDDILIAISSSGRSPNILNAAQMARDRTCWIVTLSGFKADNPLRAAGDLNFYCPSSSYRVVETVHTVICDYILESVISRNPLSP